MGVGSVAAGVMVGQMAFSRRVYGQTFLDKIFGADETDPLTPTLAKVRIGIRKVSDNLYVLLGAGGNIGLLDGKDGAIVIDSGLPERAKDVATAISAVAKNPANMLINTHYHYDHTGGNEAVHAMGFRIAAQENTRKHLSEKVTIEFLQQTQEPQPEGARPTVTFGETFGVYANGESIKATHVAPAHTDSDAYLVFEKANVVQTGDLFFNGFYPFIDYSTGGSLDGMIAAEEKLLTLVDGQTKIIPGHGPVGGKADLQTALDMLRTVRDVMVPLAKSGKSVEEVVAGKPMGVFKGKFSAGFLDDDTFTKLIYMCYTHKA